ncbi:hypothetical protein VSR01_27940 [Actinacidiphila sp. DG2A-62]|uniref:hypothetical protein n=1 Tax=Actinacidiphila sp. DG2A-62 TaxID=3108821 RepID=UPI002DB69EEC|nr:hypothetical protein [Actinacidiphila sp. DG2A-62]MEC3997125.1 hypothetical protein [Actinacidiphila sp. DG2A-62]
MWNLSSNSQNSRVRRVICVFASDTESRTLTLVPPTAAADEEPGPIETGLADVVTLQRRRQAKISVQDEESFFVDTLTEYQLDLPAR